MKKETFVFILPALVLIVAFMLLPVAESLYLSFFSDENPNLFVGLANYIDVFKDPAFLDIGAILRGQPPFGAMVNNLIWIVIHLPLSLALGLLFALLLIKLPKLSFLRSFIFIGMIVPGVVIGIITQFLFEKSSGMVSNFFALIGVEKLHISWFSHPETALIALILTHVWTWTGYSMIVFFSALTALPTSYIEAGIVDGASGWQIFRFIELPLLSRSVRTVVVMSVIAELTSFDIVYSSTYGGPGGASNVMGLQMYLEAFRYAKFSTGSAIATIVTLIAAVPIYFNVRASVRQS
ncbi:MAG: sugar ABC transporter permease [Rectinemataceae bacterium]